MSEWMVPLVVGIVGSVATVAVGFLTYRQSRRDVRDNLKRDIELHKSLPSDWTTAQSHLRWYIEERIVMLPVEEVSARKFRWLLLIPLLGGPVAAWSASRHGADSSFLQFLWRYMAIYAPVVGAAICVAGLRRTVFRGRNREMNRSMLSIARLRANHERAIDDETADEEAHRRGA